MLKSMLRKHAAQFGDQWDKYLSGILFSYQNTPHTSNTHYSFFLILIAIPLQKLCFFPNLLQMLKIHLQIHSVQVDAECPKEI